MFGHFALGSVNELSELQVQAVTPATAQQKWRNEPNPISRHFAPGMFNELSDLLDNQG
jgi:hypothetical protein